jgi:5-methylcytosine-specific restriction endonuclease McrA
MATHGSVHQPVYDSTAWKLVRKSVLARDGFRCQIRLPGCLGRATAADHVVELEDGGSPYSLSNLQAACRPCNTAKRNRSLAKRARQLNPTQLRRW